jgi:hypothetical protein
VNCHQSSHNCSNVALPQKCNPEAEFLDVIGTNVSRVFLLGIHSHLYSRILLPHPLKLVCNVNIEYRNLKSENSQDCAQRPQRNCTFMNSASVLSAESGGTQIQTLANAEMALFHQWQVFKTFLFFNWMCGKILL